MNRKERITVRLTQSQHMLLKELTESLNTSYSMLIRTIVQDFISKNEESLQRIIDEKNMNNANTEKES